MKYTPLISLILLLLSCAPKEENVYQVEQSRQEILAAEKAFAAMAAQEGVPAAFLAFASDEAVLNRNNKLLKGKGAIKAYFDSQTLKNVKLDWTPEFIDVSASGDLGYTYGPFTFSAMSEQGDTLESSGIFHTVWKRQANGEWKYVWD